MVREEERENTFFSFVCCSISPLYRVLLILFFFFANFKKGPRVRVPVASKIAAVEENYIFTRNGRCGRFR